MAAGQFEPLIIMYFGIRGKVALLVIIATAASALLVSRILSKKAEQVLREHELVDLGDEALLRGWNLVDRIQGMQDDIFDLAYDQDFARELYSGKANPERLSELAETVCRRYWKRHLRIDVIEWDQSSGEVTKIQLVEQKAEFSPQHLELPDEQMDDLYVSPIRRTKLTRLDFPGVDRVDQIEPIVTGITKLQYFGDEEDTSGGRQFYVRILTSLDTRLSPRHFFALENEEHEQLVRHDEFESKERGNDEVFLALINQEDVQKALSEALIRIRNDVMEVGNLVSTEKPKVIRLAKTDYVPLKSNYFFLEGVPGESLQEALKEDNENNEEEFDLFSDSLFIASRSLGRMGGIGGTGELRLMAQTREKMESLRSLIVDRLKERYGDRFDGFDWRDMVECDEIHAWAVVFYVGVGDSQRHYILHYCVMDDELASSIQHEMSELQKLAVLVATGFGIIGFIIAVWFIRPLKRMTRTAQRITESHPERLHENLGNLVRGLDVRRRDEVGDIARASKRLFEELITFHEQLEQRVRDRTRELRKANIELERANDQLMSLSHEKDAFVAKVSHDLRQPLNAIFLQVEALKLSELDDLQKEDVEKIHDHARRELNLVNDILEYQKIIMGAETLKKDEVDVIELLNDLAEIHAPSAEEKGIEFAIRHDDDIGTLIADDGRLHQVLSNLVGNACKFTKEGGVTVNAHAREISGESWVEFIVSDTGRGMSPDEQSKAFVPFVSNKKDNAGGTGLGLSICKELTAQMGGKIGFVSELGSGTHFSVFIPRAPSSEYYDGERNVIAGSFSKDSEEGKSVDDGVEPATSPAEAKARLPSGGGTILVIDDDETVRELLQRLLEEDGYSVITAEDGNSGLEMARKHSPDAITLDVVMPGGKDGWEVLKALKESPETEPIPVIMVSVMAEKENGIALDVEDYLVKPIDVARLSRVISRVTHQSHQRNLLLVDDDTDSLESLSRILQDAGWQTTTATNGKEALAVLERTRPGAIVLDLMMPEMDGFEFLRRLHADPDLRTIPVVVMTGKEPSADEESFLRSHVATVLTKGEASSVDLLTSIRERIRAAG